KTRMRPILMTALTTILSMSVMVFSQDAGNAMQRSMAVVVSVGLLYSTLMTLFVVPVLYDIFYRKQPKVIDVGDDLDDEADETEDFVNEME
ncbi:MAG: efflux RND transporter permease subunit, partial [Ruminococcus sp.]|nr:efflux RND transporter permease subunit [Ruminococcus sp.]